MEKTAFLFAGQGSQYVGMGKDLYEASPQARQVFDTADKILGSEIGKKCFAGPAEEIKVTCVCQLAVLTVDIACYEAFRARHDFTPGYVAGLSLGEYPALVAAGVLSFVDALKIVRQRAQLMDQAAAKFPGKMAAIIGLDRETVKQICLDSGKVAPANFNSPGQIVISGEKPAVDKAKALAVELKARMAIDLEVSGAFHSELMREAAMQLKDFIAGFVFNDPRVPVISNFDALPKTKGAAIRESLVEQVYKPVLWEDSMRFILAQGTVKFFEFGPGKVLKGLMRRIDPGAEVTTVTNKEDLDKLS